MSKNYFSSFRPVLLISVFLFGSLNSASQEQTLRLSLDEVINLAREQSTIAIMSRHRFRGSYWEYRTHRAKFLPRLNLESTLPSLTRAIERLPQDDGSDKFVERSLMNNSLNMRLNQNIPFSGGSIFMQSELERIDLLTKDGGTSYLTTPVSIGIRQPIRAYNAFKWERQIEPLKYEEAKKELLEAYERVSQQAVEYFFQLAVAQVNLQIAEVNYSNNDTLYQIARGRYNIGTIAENELLTMELSLLNAGTALNEAKMQLDINEFQLRSFLGFNETVAIDLILPNKIPELEIEVAEALQQARQNSPDILEFERRLLEANRDVSQARAEKGINANLFASLGLTQTAVDFSNAYVNPLDQQRITVGLEVPILDWGLGRGQYKMARSSQEVVRTNVKQDKIDFEQEVMLQVMQFNLQDDQLMIAAKADTIAQLRYDVSKERFRIGKISVTDLNIALAEKDDAKRNYLNTLRNYWSYFYNLRRLTLYDFQHDRPLEENFETLVE